MITNDSIAAETINYGIGKSDSIRNDNRTANQLRSIECTSHVLSRSSGSVQYSQGTTSLYCSIHTPVQCTYRDELNDRCIIQCNIYQPAQSNTTTTDVMYNTIIESIFTHIIDIFTYPRMKLIISVQVIHNDGSLLSCIINGIMLALLDSGIQLNSLCSSSTLLLQHEYNFNNNTTQSFNITLDPILSEQNAANNTMVAVYSTTQDTNKLIQLYCNVYGDSITPDQYFDTCNVAQLTCKHMIEYIKSVHEKRLQALNS